MNGPSFFAISRSLGRRKTPHITRRKQARRRLIETLEPRHLLAALTWNTDSDGDWHDPGNWIDEQGNAGVPGFNDTVVIDRGAADPTVTVNADAVARSIRSTERLLVNNSEIRSVGSAELAVLELNAATFTINSQSTITDRLNWTSGELNILPGLTIAAGAVLDASAAGSKTLTGRLDNFGEVVQSTTMDLFRVTIDNHTGARWDLQGDVGLHSTSDSMFHNSGTLRKVAGSGESRFTGSFSTSIRFNHRGGTIDVQSGTLRLTGSERQHRIDHGATFLVAQGAVLDLTGGNDSAYYSGYYSGIGAGSVVLNSGTLRTDRTGNPGAAVFDFPVGMFVWTDGSVLGSAAAPLVNRGTITVSGQGNPRLENHLINEGLIELQAGLTGVTSTELRNEPDALIDIQADIMLDTIQLTNAGTISKSGGAGESLFGLFSNVMFVQQGSLDVRSGRLKFVGSITIDTAAAVVVASGAVIELAPRLDSFGGGALFGGGRLSGSGDGRVELTTGLQALEENPLRLNFPEGMFHWIGAVDGMSHGSVVNEGSITLVGPEPINARVNLTNRGTIIQSADAAFSLKQTSFIVNDGLWDIRGDADLEIVNFQSFGSTFFNLGTLLKSAGSEVSTISGNFGRGTFFSNAGVVDVRSGVLEIAVPVKQLDAAGTLHGGQWVAGPGSTIRILDANDAVPSITTNLAGISLEGSLSTFANLSGLVENGGTLQLRGGRDLATAGDLVNGVERTSTQVAGIHVRGTNRLIALAVDPLNDQYFQLRRGESIRRFTADGTEILPAIPRPGGLVDSVSDLEFTTSPINVGGTLVPSGSLIYISGQNSPPMVYALDVASGETIASVALDDVPASTPGIAVDSSSGRIFVLSRSAGDNIHEVDPSTGVIIQSLSAAPQGSPSFNVEFGDIEVVGETGNLLVVGSGQPVLRELTPTGELVRDMDLANSGISSVANTLTLSALALNDVTGELRVQNEHSVLAILHPLETATRGTIRIGSGSTLSVNGHFVDRSPNSLHFQVAGRPSSGGFGTLRITGDADLGGNIEVETVDGFGPTAGDAYDIISYANRNGPEPSFSGVDPLFDPRVESNRVVLNALATASDLAIDGGSISAPPTARPGESLTVSYTVQNLSNTELPGGWFDSAFLSRDRALSADDLLIGSARRIQPIGGHGSYQVAIDGVMPPVVDGEWFVIGVSDAARTVADVDRGNNWAIAAATLKSTVPVIAIGESITEAMEAGTSRYYRLDVSAQPATTHLSWQADTANASLELFVDQGRLPSRSRFAGRSSERDSPVASIRVEFFDQPTYVLAYARQNQGSFTATLSASIPPLSIDRVARQSIGNEGTATIELFGSRLSNDLEYQLVGGQRTLVAVNRLAGNTGENAWATFDVDGAPLGDYDLEARDPTSGQQVTLENAIEIVAATRSDLLVELLTPSQFRNQRVLTAALIYENAGNVDMVTPVVTVFAANALLNRQRGEAFDDNQLRLLGVPENSNLAVLGPGERRRVEFRVFPTGGDISLQAQHATSRTQAVIDWDAIEADFRPDGLPDNQWDPFWIPFTRRAGNTWESYLSLLAEFAGEVASLGGDPQSLDEVFALARQLTLEEESALRRGTMQGAEGRPVANQPILFRNLADSEIAGLVITRSDGTFVIGGVSSGEYELTAQGYLLEPATITVPAERSNVPLIVSATRGGTVSGRIEQRSSKRGVTAQSVTLQSRDGTVFLSAATNSEGNFEIRGVPAGEYFISTDVEGFGATRQEISIDGGSLIDDLIIELDPASQIVGVLRTDSGPVTQGLVVVTDEFGLSLSGAVSHDGGFILDGLAPGRWTVRADLPQLFVNEQTVEFASGTTTDLGVLAAQAGSTLFVDVVDSSATAAEELLVVVEGEKYTFSAVTSTSGTAVFDNVPQGTFAIVVHAENHVPVSQPVEIIAGDNTASITLTQGGIIRGSVTDANDVPIAGIDVQFFDEGLDGFAQQSAVKTDENGNFEILPLDFGTYAVSVGNAWGIQRELLELSADDPVHLQNFQIGRAAVRGVVQGSDNVPLGAAAVIISQNGERLAVARTDQNGRYILRGFDDGDYRLTVADATGFSPSMPVSLDSTTVNVAPTLQPGNHTLTISVRESETGQAVVYDALLTPIAPELDGFGLRNSEESTFEGLIAADYLLRVESPGFATHLQTVSLSGSMTIAVTLERGIPLTGVVQSNSGRRLAEALVIASDPATGIRLAAATTNAEGRYILSGVSPGEVDLQVSAESKQIAHLRSVLIDGSNRVHDFVLRDTSTIFRLRTIDSDGTSLAGAIFELRDHANRHVLSGRTDFRGEFATRLIPEGRYRVEVGLTGYRSIVAEDVQVDRLSEMPNEIVLPDSGTDDILTTNPFVWVSELVGGGLSKIALSDVNPVPERDGRDVPLPPLEICDPPNHAKEQAMADMITAKRLAEQAFEGWDGLHKSFNITVGSRLLQLRVQIADLAARIAGIVASPALAEGRDKAELLLEADSFNQAALVLYKAYGEYRTLSSNYSKSLSALRASDGSAGSVLNVIGAFAKDTLKIFGDTAGLLDTLQQMSKGKKLAGPLGKFADSRLGALLKAGELAQGFIDGFQEYQDLLGTVPNARELYTRAVNRYLAARRAYLSHECPPCEENEDCAPDPPEPGPTRQIRPGTSADPNDKLTVGIGDQGFIRDGQTITYTIRFENMPTADLPAQEVFVSDFLSAGLDWSTLELIEIGFNNVSLNVPEGLREYSARTEVPTDRFPVDVSVTFDSQTGHLHTSLRSVDPSFGGLPEIPDAGFLPPNDDLGSGQGLLTFRVTAKTELEDGDQIENLASIVFDDNDPIVTNTTINTIDDAVPTSSVDPLPETSLSTSFLVSWSAEDGVGSGVASYDILVSQNDGPFELWFADTVERSAVFTGEIDQTYAFVSVATDRVGMVETLPIDPDTLTVVRANPWTNPDQPFDVNGRDGITALDALTIILELQRRLVSDPETQRLVATPPTEFAPPFYDVSGEGRVTALDAVRVINELARISIQGVSAEQIQQHRHVEGSSFRIGLHRYPIIAGRAVLPVSAIDETGDRRESTSHGVSGVSGNVSHIDKDDTLESVLTTIAADVNLRRTRLASEVTVDFH